MLHRTGALADFLRWERGSMALEQIASATRAREFDGVDETATARAQSIFSASICDFCHARIESQRPLLSLDDSHESRIHDSFIA
jgi:hypothetical protein